MSLVVQMMKDLGGDQAEKQSRESNILLNDESRQKAASELPLFAAADELHKQERRLILGRNFLFIIIALVLIAFVATWNNNYFALVNFKNNILNIEPLKQLTFYDNAVIDKKIEDVSLDKQIKINKNTTGAIVLSQKETLSKVVDPLRAAKTVENSSTNNAVGFQELSHEKNAAPERSHEKPGTVQETISIPQPIVNKSNTVNEKAKNDTTINVPAVYAVKPDIQQKEPINAATESMTKVLSLESQDQSLVLEARSLVDNNFIDSALKLLARRTAEDTSLIESAAMYAMLLTARQQHEMADEVITRYRKMEPQHLGLIKSHIRLFVATDKFEEALHLISQHGLPAHVDKDFLVLKAAIFQEQYNWPQAITAYQQLLSLDNEHARSWLGLAVALDAQGEFENARGAYQRAIAIGELETHLHNYALNRIAML